MEYSRQTAINPREGGVTGVALVGSSRLEVRDDVVAQF